MNWQHKPPVSPDFTRGELESILSFCASDPSLEGVRLKVEESLSVYEERDRLLERARTNEEEVRKESAGQDEMMWKEMVWAIFDPAVREELGALGVRGLP